MSSTLLIVDPQNDFITGSLPVPGAEEQLTQLALALARIKVENIIVTMDCHPIGHVSFIEQGGRWPIHCLKYDEGAAILNTLYDELYQKAKESKIHFIEKATSVDVDQYSAFETQSHPALDSADTIYVCGVAGDVCVHTSISDLIRLGLKEKLVVITDASPSLDEGEKLNTLIREEGLRACTLADFE